jgi:hypothetical protein
VYLHLGQDLIVRQVDVIGLFDLDNASGSHITREFLKKADRAKQIALVAEDIPKSLVLVQEGDQTSVYLSQLSTATLQKRSAGIGFEY